MSGNTILVTGGASGIGLALAERFLKAGNTVINVSSGLAFTPMASAPVYSATKAAIHSFTMSLRYQAQKQNINVIEVAPPAVNTDLGGVGLHTFGEPLDDFADAVFAGFERNQLEIGYRMSERALRLSRDEIDETFQALNDRISGANH
ncbi:hypothetical protein EL26_03255 [Tumebacillus flagellatus]|uniref:Short-chain dehydrogenase n=1 Tax=Tumebacillus flagellatus TaxID=1157490 RepID=A0A074LV77_9BACL|nr:hypothetical protein EL26_03255 [Tumebacillus flagellatus]